MGRKTKKRLVVVAAALLGLALAAIAFFVVAIAPLGTRYVAKRICSGVFISGRTADDVWTEGLSGGRFGYPGRFRYEVDTTHQAVSATWNGLAKKTVRFRPGLGCTADGAAGLPADVTEKQTGEYQTAFPFPPPASVPAELQSAVDAAFADPRVRTRAVVVLHRGRLVAERYADGWTRDTPQLGWSMTKSVAQAVIGTQILAGRLTLDQKDLFEEWRGSERVNISLLHLLQMSSGLEWNESYDNPFGDALQMLFDSDDMAAVALEKDLEYAPGQVFNYSSGTSNLLMLLLRRTLTTAGEDDLGYPQRALFAPLGMTTAVMEPDPSGTFAGSSFAYASALDWARFGQLFLLDGLLDGVRVLPEGWLETSCTPALASNGQYGAHFWLRVGPHLDAKRPGALPLDVCHAAGHEGQYVSLVPSHSLVVVRLGLTRPGRLWDQEAFVVDIVGALAKRWPQ